METTKALVWSWLVACVSLGTALPATAQTPVVGALAIDERQGDQYGWAVDYETAAAARAGPFVDSKTNGTWVIRSANGTVEEWLFRDGERVR